METLPEVEFMYLVRLMHSEIRNEQNYLKLVHTGCDYIPAAVARGRTSILRFRFEPEVTVFLSNSRQISCYYLKLADISQEASGYTD